MRLPLASLHPASFALAMATGIVSIGCLELGLHGLAGLLYGLNLVAYGLLWLATVLKGVYYPRAFLADWADHQRAPGFFAWTAATCVVGVQCLAIGQAPGAAFALWCVALALWVGSTYAIFGALITRTAKPDLGTGLNGGWLLAVVATQALCVLGCGVLPGRLAPDTLGLVLACFWLAGGLLYGWLITLIAYRLLFFRLAPEQLSAPYWITMGAVAITTLAGTGLIATVPASPVLGELRPFLAGGTLLAWAVATWWIPLLVALSVWRVRRVKLAYDALSWGMVFPLGMYGVCTLRLHALFGPPFLQRLGLGACGVGLAAWAVTTLGLLLRLWAGEAD